MIPTVDEIQQQAINQLIDLVLEVSKGVTWQREYSHSGTKNKGKSLPACTWMKKNLKYKLTGMTYAIIFVHLLKFMSKFKVVDF